jgi:hypothetical protein
MWRIRAHELGLVGVPTCLASFYGGSSQEGLAFVG